MEKTRLTIGKSLVIFLSGIMALIVFYIFFSENSIQDKLVILRVNISYFASLFLFSLNVLITP